jgi:hypothetical protein
MTAGEASGGEASGDLWGDQRRKNGKSLMAGRCPVTRRHPPCPYASRSTARFTAVAVHAQTRLVRMSIALSLPAIALID